MVRLVCCIVLVLLAGPAAADRAAAADGARALEAGRFAEAEELFVRAQEGSPAKGWSWFDLCLVHHARGAFGRALDACYRALQDPATEKRVHALLEKVRDQIRAQRLPLDGIALPDPTSAWFAIEDVVAAAITGNLDDRGVRQTRVVPSPKAETVALLDDAAAERLAGRAPPSPYAVPAHPHDYTRGFDVLAKTGVLWYAADASPFVAGARVEGRRRRPGDSVYGRYFAEYLHAIDATGGIAAVGLGIAGGGTRGERGVGVELGVSVPWGEDDKRQNATISGVQIAVMFDLRLSYRYELAIGGTALSIEAGVAGGLNLGKLLDMIADWNPCDEADGDVCPEHVDDNPDWRWTYVMGHVGIGFGQRAGRPRYHEAEIFAPSGSR